MNNQIKLLLKGIRADVEAIANDRGADQRIQQWARDTFKAIGDVIDTPPVPTIKPGDKVRHEIHGYGTAHDLGNENVLVAFNTYQYAVIVPAEELEVVE